MNDFFIKKRAKEEWKSTGEKRGKNRWKEVAKKLLEIGDEQNENF